MIQTSNNKRNAIFRGTDQFMTSTCDIITRFHA